MTWKRGGRWAVALVVATLVGFGAYVAKERASKYHPYKDALFYALTTNDFAAAYATPADDAGLRAGFAFLGPVEGEEAKVLALIEWLDAHVAAKETWSVYAPVLLEQRAGACEVHALAVAALGAYGIKARWISGVRDAIGFGYLEAFVGGRWRLYRLRTDDAARVVGASALELYQRGEIGVAVRAFYPQPDERLTSWEGPLEVGLLPLANLELHPELRPLFEGPSGVALEYGHFSPYDYVFDYDPRADDAWVREGVVMARMHEMQARFRYTRRRALAALINAVDRLLGYGFEPGRVTGATPVG